jgi:glycosyltransferase involved in cell wall biosynthesis
MPYRQYVRVSVLIPTLGRPQLLADTLVTMASLATAPDEVVVVDGDPDRSAQSVLESAALPSCTDRRYLATPRGAALQRNRGLAACTGDIVLFLDDDALLDPASLGLLESAYADPAVVGATGTVIQSKQHRIDRDSSLRRLLPGGGRPGTFTRFGYPRYLGKNDRPRSVEFMMGCFMSARREHALDVGFDEHLTGSAIAEDEDFSFRLSRRGRIAFVPEARCHHRLAAPYDDERAAARATVVNRAYLFRKNFRPTLLARAQFGLLLGLLLGHRLLNRRWDSAAGIVDGMAAVARGEHRPHVPAGREISALFVGSHARTGGSERYLENLVSSLGDVGVQGVTLLEEGPAADDLRARGAPVEVMPTGTSAASILTAALRVRAGLRRRRPDVIHANGVKAALVSVLAAPATGVPVVWLKHDHSFDRNLAPYIARRCALVVGVSRSVVTSLEGLPPGKVRVVTTGVPPSEVDRAAARRELLAELGPGDALVGLVARLDPEKGHEELLAVASGLVERRPGVRFVVAGGDDPNVPGYRARLDALVRSLGLEARVTVLGHRSDVETLLAALDVLVVPSVHPSGESVEGFPLVALEALHAGTPVVAYATGGLPELLGDCGVLVAPRDRDGLLQALDELIGDPDRRASLSERGRELARERYDLARMARELSACYREAMRR